MPRRHFLSTRWLPAALVLASCGGEGPAGAASGSGGAAPSGSGATASSGTGGGEAVGSTSAGNGASASGAGGSGGGAAIQCAPGGPEGPAAPSTAKVPAAFVARGHVEALGALPDQARWEADLDAFRSKGCSAATLGAFARSLFKSAEFLALPYSNPQRLLALYRGVLGRDPDASGFAHHLAELEADPAAFCGVVDELVASAELATKAGVLCAPGAANYHFEVETPPFAIGETLSAAELQAQLDAAGPGGVVELPESALVTLDATLRVPKGVTLRTAGVPGLEGRRAYARMGRLARGAPFQAPLVRLAPGARLSNMWLDGRRLAFPDAKAPDGQNVVTGAAPTDATSIEWVRSDNPLGPQNFRFNGSTTKDGCKAGTVARQNLVYNVSNDNRLPGALWSDGIFTLCENAVAEDNEVLDASDVALIAFFSENEAPQRSKFLNNRVLNAGNDAFAAIATDPWAGASGSCKGPCNFEGLEFRDNVLWTGPNTRFVIGISAGSRAWSFIPTHGDGFGAAYRNNTSGASRVRMQIAIYVSGMHDAFLTQNWNPTLIDYVEAPAVPPNKCGLGAALANTPAHASGELQGAVPANRDDCI